MNAATVRTHRCRDTGRSAPVFPTCGYLIWEAGSADCRARGGGQEVPPEMLDVSAFLSCFLEMLEGPTKCWRPYEMLDAASKSKHFTKNPRERAFKLF